MGAAFVVTLREGFEAALLLGIVYAYLEQIGRRDGRRFVTLGALAAVAASAAMGAAVGYLSGPLADLGPDVVGVVVIFAAVTLLTWHAWWMSHHAREIRRSVERRVDSARAAGGLWVVALVAFTGVFREGAETVLFLWGLMAQAAAGSTGGALLGGVAGVTAAAVLGVAIFHGGRRVSLQPFFRATTALIVLLAAGLFSAGVGRLQGLGILPQATPLWDTSWLLEDGHGLGGFLAGLVGYRATPSALEVAAYVGYLAGAAALLCAPARRGRRPAAVPVSVAGGK